MHRTGGSTTSHHGTMTIANRHSWRCRMISYQLLDDRLIEAVRAGRVDEHHSDPVVARLLARWRTGITIDS